MRVANLRVASLRVASLSHITGTTGYSCLYFSPHAGAPALWVTITAVSRDTRPPQAKSLRAYLFLTFRGGH
jgi:hypothetical protein